MEERGLEAVWEWAEAKRLRRRQLLEWTEGEPLLAGTVVIEGGGDFPDEPDTQPNFNRDGPPHVSPGGGGRHGGHGGGGRH